MAPGGPEVKAARVLTVVVPAAVVGLGLASILVLWSVPEGPIGSIVYSALLFGTTALGAFVASRRPENAVGWLLMLAPLPAALGSLAGILAQYGETTSPFDRVAANVSLWGAQPAIFLAGAALLRFPTGRHLSRRWRMFEVVVVSAALLGMVGLAVRPGGIYVAPDIDNPLGIDAWRLAAAFLEGVGQTGQALLIAGAIASLVLRWRRSEGAARQQMKWIVFPVCMFPLLVFVSNVVDSFDTSAEGYASFGLNITAIMLIPTGIAIAVLRYRLYDIDLIINRTLVYAALTAVLVAAYAGGVLLFRTILDPVTGDNDVAIAASTLAVAALFGPARRKIQRFIDHRFYRSRYDAQQTLETFAARLRDEVDLDSLSGDLLRVVSDTVKPLHASLWLAKGTAR
jgi:hypothetical protein